MTLEEFNKEFNSDRCYSDKELALANFYRDFYDCNDKSKKDYQDFIAFTDIYDIDGVNDAREDITNDFINSLKYNPYEEYILSYLDDIVDDIFNNEYKSEYTYLGHTFYIYD